MSKYVITTGKANRVWGNKIYKINNYIYKQVYPVKPGRLYQSYNISLFPFRLDTDVIRTLTKIEQLFYGLPNL